MKKILWNASVIFSMYLIFGYSTYTILFAPRFRSWWESGSFGGQLAAMGFCLIPMTIILTEIIQRPKR